MPETLSSESVCTRLERIAEMARKHPERVFTSLGHVIDLEFLHEAHRRTRKDGATGVDGRTAAEYGEELDPNLASLLDRLKTGNYRAPPVRGVEIPKASGGTRAIGIPTFEDKVLQRAVAMVLGSIYEQDFLDCSYGFRPGRSAHDALDALWKELMNVGEGWVLEVDIESFFDTVDHRQLRSFLDERVTDGVLRRVIHKWLKAGVMREGVHRHSERGTPQGGVISPLLANVYLHHVLDVWFETVVKPRLNGRARLFRYADDVLIVFAREDDARRVWSVLPKRFAKYGLRVHPDKTRLLPFGPGRGARGERTFDFLGFTHLWGVSLEGAPIVRRKTASPRLSRALGRVRAWCRRNRHRPVRDQHRALCAMLLGHYGYYGITGNGGMLERFEYQVRLAWFKWLSRRSHRKHDWEWYAALLRRFPLPRPRIVHSVYRAANSMT
jgi:RNA-directed DNA polymerase